MTTTKNPKSILVDVAKLESHPQNARLHNIQAIRESLEQFGQYQPIVVQQSTNYVIAGNGRMAAAREMGWKKIAAIVLDLDDETARQILLADNRTSDLATYDSEALVDLLQSIEDLQPSGYSDRDIEDLLDAVKPPDSFPTVDPSSDEFDTHCPKCGFAFKK